MRGGVYLDERARTVHFDNPTLASSQAIDAELWVLEYLLHAGTVPLVSKRGFRPAHVDVHANVSLGGEFKREQSARVKAEGKVILELELAVNNAEEKGIFARKLRPEVVQSLEEHGVLRGRAWTRVTWDILDCCAAAILKREGKKDRVGGAELWKKLTKTRLKRRM